MEKRRLTSSTSSTSSGGASARRSNPRSRYNMAKGSVRDSGSIRDAGRNAPSPSSGDDEGRSSVFAERTRKPNPVREFINAWFDRLVGAVSDGSFSAQDEVYAAGRTSRDFVWNTAGFATWGMVFPMLTIVVTWLAGVERAGMFSFAFVIANLLYILASYGVRTYQVSDIDEFHSFADYQVNRIVTCAIMLVVGFVVCKMCGYTGEMLSMSMGVFAFKAIDAFGEVHEGRLQQVDKLYLGGISLTLRSVGAFIVFALLLAVTKDLGIASIGMAVAAACTLVFATIPLTMFESPRSSAPSLRSVKLLFEECFPVFLALFLYAVVDNMPKFVMQGASLPYDNQLYFNALYFPAQAILITVGMIYKPMLVKLASVWADESRRARFDIVIVAMMTLILAITIVGVLFMNWLGIPLMSIMYGLDFEPYKQLSFIMLAAGGVTAAIDFLYQVITILRRQQVVVGLYLITFMFSLLVLVLMITMMKLEGAVVGYLIVMSILLILLVREYVTQRLKFSRSAKRR